MTNPGGNIALEPFTESSMLIANKYKASLMLKIGNHFLHCT
jgi:hypothetical protein